ncbi:hypothetical protein H5410_058902 [Solanum commersonii]|uniref:Uncharacterized protein n=1 Tax=Solanum commersonii TaxID=4109 RepID=A0A9J5W1B0_SOLCO|nr:hypothetical protein H5410_058902 [Solanum commersonii]
MSGQLCLRLLWELCVLGHSGDLKLNVMAITHMMERTHAAASHLHEVVALHSLAAAWVVLSCPAAASRLHEVVALHSLAAAWVVLSCPAAASRLHEMVALHSLAAGASRLYGMALPCLAAGISTRTVFVLLIHTS